ncbi:MAG: epoxyqueuosine reductase [Proteobacteria bacterium]|nr:epoxyqueuosine reductase [Pseudomonadota bacterium]
MSVNSKQLTKELDTFTRHKGADLFGVADLEPAGDFLASHGDPIASGYPRAISIGMRINDAIVENHDPDEPRGKSLYWHHIYDVVSEALNFVAYDVSRWLANRGWDALPVPASMPYNLKKLQGVISHKLPAHLAGLGWIGKNCLLLSREFGPRVRFATVLTDAPLAEGTKKDKKCGKCRVCIDACPVGAFTDVEFSPTDDVDVRFDTAKCSEYRSKHPCGLCVSTCPLGENAQKRRKKLRDG